MSSLRTEEKQSFPSVVESLEFRELEKHAAEIDGNEPSPYGNINLTPAAIDLRLDALSKFFDITSHEFSSRIKATSTVSPKFLEELAGRVDFYGPLWGSCSVVVFGTISNLIRYSSLNSMSYIAIITIFYLGAASTLAMWKDAPIRPSELFTIHGYSLIYSIIFIFINTIFQDHIPKLLSNIISAGLSAFFLYRNIFPILRTSTIPRKKSIVFAVSAAMTLNHIIFYCLLAIIL